MYRCFLLLKRYSVLFVLLLHIPTSFAKSEEFLYDSSCDDHVHSIYKAHQGQTLFPDWDGAESWYPGPHKPAHKPEIEIPAHYDSSYFPLIKLIKRETKNVAYRTGLRDVLYHAFGWAGMGPPTQRMVFAVRNLDLLESIEWELFREHDFLDGKIKHFRCLEVEVWAPFQIHVLVKYKWDPTYYYSIWQVIPTIPEESEPLVNIRVISGKKAEEPTNSQ